MSIDLIEPVMEFVESNLHFIRFLLPVAGGLAGLVGMVVAIRIILPPVDVPARWRYRTDSPGLRIAAAPARVDIRPARHMARFLLGIALILPVIALFIWVAQPGDIGGLPSEPPWYEVALPWAGAIGYFVGLGWMIRIYRRSHLEPEMSFWRYRI